MRAVSIRRFLSNMVFYSAMLLACLLIIEPSLENTADSNENVADVQFYEGDIILTRYQQRLLESSNVDSIHGPQNAVARSEDFLWPGGIITYEIDSSLDASAVQAVYEAIDEYMNRTCIRFKPRDVDDADFVKFHKGSGCSSYVGRTTGQQEISIGRGCDKKGIVIHELFHALGRWHEQARVDRNEYITINRMNIRQGYETNFNIISQVFATTQGVPYDYDSVMHYRADAFSANGEPTIEPINSDIDIQRLGQREGMSENDIAHVRALYCGGDGEWSGWGSWSSCSRSCNGGIRSRRRTCIGDTSCLGTNIDEMLCHTEECPSIPTWSEWSAWSGCTALCGGGRRSRIRVCENGNICEGDSQEYESCNEQNCTESSSSWSSWSECSQTCHGGYRYRSRVCPTGDCLEETREIEKCNSNISCVQWSECSRSCGGGTQVYHSTQKTRSCNEHPCHNEICLKGINHIGCYNLSLLGGLMEYLQASDNDKTEPIRKCGDLANSRGHPYFVVTFGLCYSGTNELESYLNNGAESEMCKNGTGGYFESSFIGNIYYIEDPQEFVVSSVGAKNCGFDYCTDSSLIGSCDIPSGAVSIITSSFSLTLLLLILIYCLTINFVL